MSLIVRLCLWAYSILKIKYRLDGYDFALLLDKGLGAKIISNNLYMRWMSFMQSALCFQKSVSYQNSIAEFEECTSSFSEL